MTKTVGAYAVQVGQRMREVREARGMSLMGVEKASCGQFDADTLAMWERGQRGMPAARLMEYAAWLGVHVKLLLPPDTGGAEWRESVVADAADRALRSVSATIASLSPAEASDLLVSALTERQAS